MTKKNELIPYQKENLPAAGTLFNGALPHQTGDGADVGKDADLDYRQQKKHHGALVSAVPIIKSPSLVAFGSADARRPSFGHSRSQDMGLNKNLIVFPALGAAAIAVIVCGLIFMF